MSFQSAKSTLGNIFVVLKQQASLTNEQWKDPVQERFYEQFINSLPKEFNAYISSLIKLENSFKKAEQNIIDMQK